MVVVLLVEVNKTTYVSEKSLKMMMMVVVVEGLACHVPISVHCYFFG